VQISKSGAIKLPTRFKCPTLSDMSNLDHEWSTGMETVKLWCPTMLMRNRKKVDRSIPLWKAKPFSSRNPAMYDTN
jgi:hypothetical protein